MTVKSLVLNLFITFAASSAASYYTAAGFVEQILTVLFAKNLANQLSVGFHHSLRVNGRKIDLRGFQVFMPQSLADDGQADSHVYERDALQVAAKPVNTWRKMSLSVVSPFSGLSCHLSG